MIVLRLNALKFGRVLSNNSNVLNFKTIINCAMYAPNINICYEAIVLLLRTKQFIILKQQNRENPTQIQQIPKRAKCRHMHGIKITTKITTILDTFLNHF